MNIKEKALELHKKSKGKFEIKSKVKIKNKKNLALAYSPGVAEPCLKILHDKNKSYEYTTRGNLIAIITDGSAVLGMGNIGALPAMPVMEGKAILFKQFANIDAIPICLNTNNTEEIIQTIKNLEPSFGGINLEDISAPRCFEIEERLKKELEIPVFHDDQHGTAIAVLAGLINSLKITKKKPTEIKVVVNGAGAAGVAITKLLLGYGIKDIIVCDSKGIIHKKRELNNSKKELADITNKKNQTGDLKKALKDSDVFIGVSVGNILNNEMIKSMKKNSIVFALANPIPEVTPEFAKKNGVKIIATGRSDYPNQINNVLVFPGIFRGLLDYKIKYVNDKIKITVAKAIAKSVRKPNKNKIIPDVFNKKVINNIKKAMKKFS
ncbi:MAG: NADP-dependent malic enzyme [Candidatus Pacearchaeota archaeon]|nr:NADP-dependent malic enzyme [Candidatus Pacearchaeota archaeon]